MSKAQGLSGHPGVGNSREGSTATLRRQLAGDLDQIVLMASAKSRTAAVVIALAAGVGATVREARIAAANERRAEERFNDVRKLANALMFELHDSIQDLAGATAARKLIVERAVEYLDSLAQESRSDPSLQRELAGAYKRIGDVQGGPFAANVGDTTAALKSYQKALAIRQALLDARTGWPLWFRLRPFAGGDCSAGAIRRKGSRSEPGRSEPGMSRIKVIRGSKGRFGLVRVQQFSSLTEVPP